MSVYILEEINQMIDITMISLEKIYGSNIIQIYHDEIIRIKDILFSLISACLSERISNIRLKLILEDILMKNLIGKLLENQFELKNNLLESVLKLSIII